MKDELIPSGSQEEAAVGGSGQSAKWIQTMVFPLCLRLIHHLRRQLRQLGLSANDRPEIRGQRTLLPCQTHHETKPNSAAAKTQTAPPPVSRVKAGVYMQRWALA